MFVDRISINRWATRCLLLLEKAFRKHKRPFGENWRVDVTLGVDNQAKTVDFLLTAKRDKGAANRFFEKAMRHIGNPEIVTMAERGANKLTIEYINQDRERPVVVRQIKYLNNIAEQDRRAIKLVTKPMLNVKAFCYPVPSGN